MWSAHEPRALCRRGVPRGARSPAFSVAELLLALHAPRAQYVYAELDAAGAVTAAGGAARLAVSARLAPSALAGGAELVLAAGATPPGAALALRTVAPLAPHQELVLWFADDVLAALDMPVLAPHNIQQRHYACHLCGAAFADPNPLKLHLFLRCEPFTAPDFWRRAAECLRAVGPSAVALGPAELEALATAWGRARDGHVCVYCGKLYSRRYGLKIHVRTHTGYRPLRCRYCARAFGDPSNLNKHVRLHLARAATPLSCAQCGRGVARRRDLLRHMRAHARSAVEPPPLTDPPT